MAAKMDKIAQMQSNERGGNDKKGSSGESDSEKDEQDKED